MYVKCVYKNFTLDNSNNSTESQLPNEKEEKIEANAKKTKFCCYNLKKVNTLGWIIMIGG